MPETVDKEETHNNLISHSTNIHTHTHTKRVIADEFVLETEAIVVLNAAAE